MPRFNVTKGHDAYVLYEAVVDRPDITTVAEAIEWAGSPANAAQLEWTGLNDTEEYDHFAILDAEMIEPEQLELAI